jgi:hypothetical protein
MIRVLEEVLPVLQNAAAYDGSVYRVTLAGDSTEEKPTRGIMTGSKFIETDTGKTLYFNETTHTWA